MTRTTTVSGIRPDKAGDGEWIDINGHVGRLMSTLMADGRPFSIDVTPGGMTTVTPLPPPKDAEAAGGDAQAETEPADGSKMVMEASAGSSFWQIGSVRSTR